MSTATRFSLLRTTAFRVAALYAFLYAFLTAAIVAMVLVATHDQIGAQVQAGLKAESLALTALYVNRGSIALVHAVAQRSNAVFVPGDRDADDPGRRFYALASAQGKILAGDFRHWPTGAPTRGWFRFRFRGGGPRIEALVRPLPGGNRLLIGQSLRIPDQLTDSFKLWGAVAAGLMFLAGLAGGVAIGRSVMKRIAGASATAERIRGGRLGERLDETGPGEHVVLARAFNAMLERIETAVLGLHDLGSRMAHEIKHPLARASRALERAATATGSDPGKEIAHAREELAELDRRVEALLRLAQLEGGASTEFFREFDLGALVADLAELYLPVAQECGQRIENHTRGRVRCTGDRQLIAQALVNLLENALRYAPRTAPIILTARAAGRQLVLEVHDGGKGPPEGGGRRPGGAGLGLAIARAIARLHEGTLELEHDSTGFTARLRMAATAGA